MTEELHEGLEGVLVSESSLSFIDGDEGRLVYRGYAIEDLAAHATYEEVLYLLWHGELPTRDDLEEFTAEMATEREIADEVVDLLRALVARDEEPMAALRTGVSALSAYEPEADADDEDLAASLRKGRRITAKVPTLIAAYDRLRRGEDPVAPREDLGHAANFLYMFTGEEPDDVAAETFDMALTLHADHGLNASTFTAIVVASTLADMYSSVTGGIGALSGSLHGGANQDVMELLVEIDESGEDPVDWIADAVDDGLRVPGWGHRVYNVKDPRAVILEEKSRELGETSGERKWFDIAHSIEEYLLEHEDFAERGLAPNVDFYSGTVYYQLGIPLDLYTPIFALSRTGGWIAHVLEYQEDNRLIRPLSRYVGETDRDWVPIEDR